MRCMCSVMQCMCSVVLQRSDLGVGAHGGVSSGEVGHGAVRVESEHVAHLTHKRQKSFLAFWTTSLTPGCCDPFHPLGVPVGRARAFAPRRPCLRTHMACET